MVPLSSTLWSNPSLVEALEGGDGNKDGLDHKVEESGTNFSAGERQIICMDQFQDDDGNPMGGRAAEVGTPGELLSNSDGIFTSLVNETGEASAAFLKGVANGEIDIDAHEAAAGALTNAETPSSPKIAGLM